MIRRKLDTSPRYLLFVTILIGISLVFLFSGCEQANITPTTTTSTSTSTSTTNPATTTTTSTTNTSITGTTTSTSTSTSTSNPVTTTTTTSTSISTSSSTTTTASTSTTSTVTSTTTTTTTLPSPTVSGDLTDYLASIEGDIPSQSSQIYVNPSVGQRTAFAGIINSLLALEIETASTEADNYSYTVVVYEDTDNNLIYSVLKENLPISKGWGTYVINHQSNGKKLIEIPHPKYDLRTGIVGRNLFKELGTNSKAYLLAGTHRYAVSSEGVWISDVAHNSDSIFETVQETLLTSSSEAIQIHGFSYSSHPALESASLEVVLSNGTSNAPSSFNDIEDLLENSYSLDVGIYDNSTITELGATTNVQGQYINNNSKGTFYHFEAATYVRTIEANRENYINALEDYFDSN